MKLKIPISEPSYYSKISVLNLHTNLSLFYHNSLKKNENKQIMLNYKQFIKALEAPSRMTYTTNEIIRNANRRQYP